MDEDKLKFLKSIDDNVGKLTRRRTAYSFNGRISAVN
jgi:hypothetical protein